TYEENLALLNAHLAKPNLFRAQRHKLFLRKQQPGESTADYIAALRKQAMLCKFRNNYDLEDHLIDAIIFGTNSDSARKSLFKKEQLTLKDAVEILSTEELASRECKSLTTGTN